MPKSSGRDSPEPGSEAFVQRDEFRIETFGLRRSVHTRALLLLIQFGKGHLLFLGDLISRRNKFTVRSFHRCKRGLVGFEALHDFEFDLLECVLAPAQGLQLTHKCLRILGAHRSGLQALLVAIRPCAHLLDVGFGLRQLPTQVVHRSSGSNKRRRQISELTIEFRKPNDCRMSGALMGNLIEQGIQTLHLKEPTLVLSGGFSH